jgi:chromosome segregation ATPase
MKRLRYKKLWLVSEQSRGAFSINFHPQMTLLVGKNRTGKSTLVKHIFQTLGCETLGKSDKWDSLALSVLSFECDGIDYLAYRKANAYALKNTKTGEIKATTNYKEWAEIIAGLFDFRLQLQTHQDQLRQATPPYLFLPYYIDQDGGWQKQWNSFDKLTQFHGSWKKVLISYVTGQRPNEYFRAKMDWTLAKADKKELEQELGAVQTALTRVKKSLPKSSIRFDQNAFRQEINELLRDASALQKDQESLRAKAFTLGASKQSLSAQIQMAKSSLREVEGDLKYLTETQPDGKMICPTCGEEHQNAFPVRYELVEDAATLRGIVGELEIDLQKVEKDLSSVQSKISQLRNREREIEKSLQIKKGALKLRDVIESQSAEVVRAAFSTDIGTLRKGIERRDDEILQLKAKVDQYDAPDRAKTINDYYAERIQLFASELTSFQELGDDIKARPDATVKATGSTLPRAILAYQYAIIHTAKEKGDAKLFPIVVDSPNQQAQDKDNLGRILKFILNRTPADQQLVLTVEEDPGLEIKGDKVTLDKPFGLLNPEQYEPVREELQEFIGQVNIEIDKHINKPINLDLPEDDAEE